MALIERHPQYEWKYWQALKLATIYVAIQKYLEGFNMAVQAPPPNHQNEFRSDISTCTLYNNKDSLA